MLLPETYMSYLFIFSASLILDWIGVYLAAVCHESQASLNLFAEFDKNAGSDCSLSDLFPRVVLP